MAELSEKWWKKNKAKTLRKESVTKALKEYEKWEGKRRASGWSENVEGVYIALSVVERSIAETKKNCNSKLHKETMGHLDDLAKVAAVTKKQLDGHKRNAMQWLKNVVPRVDAWESAWKAVLAAPSGASLKAYEDAAKKACDVLKLQESPYPAVGEFFGNAGGTLFRYADLHAKEARQHVPAFDQAKAGDAAAKTKMLGVIREWTSNVKQLSPSVKIMRGLAPKK